MTAVPVWIDPATGYLYCGAAGQPLVQLSLSPGSASSGTGGTGMANPMTTAGDMIVGGTSGSPARLAKGSDGNVLGMKGGVEAWLAGLDFVQGRLTLTTGVPVPTADAIGATNVFFTPFKDNLVTLWDGTGWITVSFTEQTLALGTVTAALCYDVFAFLNAGALNIEKLAWTSATARATTVTLQDGRYCKNGDKTRRYLGTFYTTSTTATEDSGGGVTTQVGGKRFLWNYYNRTARNIGVFDTTDSWAYTTNTIRQANGAAGNKVECVIGIAEELVEVYVCANVSLRGNTSAAKAGVGLDSTVAFQGFVQEAFNGGTTLDQNFPLTGQYSAVLTVGYHAISWNEKGATGTSCLFLGDNGGDSSLSGLVAKLFG